MCSTPLGHEDMPGAALRPVLNTSCGANSTAFSDFYKLKENYIPANGQTEAATVTKKIKIRLVILESNPAGSYQSNYRAGDIGQLYNFVNRTNYWLGHLAAPTHPVPAVCGSCHVTDSRIRVELHDIDFREDTNPSPNYLVGSDAFENQGKYKDSILNVYFFFNPIYFRTDSFGNPIVDASGDSSFIAGAWVNTFGYNYTNSNDVEQHNVAFVNLYKGHADMDHEARRFAHELGHTIGGLYHLGQEYSVADKDYLNDIFASNNPPVTPVPGPTNNFLDVDGVGSTFSPMQLGRLHRRMFISSAKKYIYPTEAPTAHPWIVGSDETWDFAIRMFQDIRVKSGAVLTIKCAVQMPADGRIVVETGGKLVVDGGLITSYHGKRTWKGIELVGNNNMSSNPQYQGSIELKNGAIIENADAGLRNFSSINGAQGGGIIIARNSHFFNCWRAVELNDYSNFSYAAPFSTTTNCSFDNVTFSVDETAPFLSYTNGVNGHLFTSYNTKSGILIKNCTFKNEIPLALEPQGERGRAINFIATGAKIINNTFDGFTSGIYVSGYTGTPTRNAYIYDNSLSGITSNITVAADAYSDIRSNNISDMRDYSQLGSIVAGTGIYLDNTNGSYVGCGNRVNGFSTTSLINRKLGAIINNSGASGAVIKNNRFSNLQTGTQTQRNNPNLTISCNQYEGNNLAIGVNPESNGSSYYLKNQGTGAAANQTRAGNNFPANSNQRDIASYLNNQWQYYAFTCNTSNSQFPFNTSGNIYLVNCNFGTAITDPNSQCNNLSDCMSIASIAGHNAVLRDYNNLVTAGMKESIAAQRLRSEVIHGYNEQGDAMGLTSFLESENDDKADRLLIPLYIENGQHEKVENKIKALPISQPEKDAYTSYYGILIDLSLKNRSISTLTSQEQQTISTLAADDLEVSPFAKALMEWQFNEPWDHPVEEETENPKNKQTGVVTVAAEASSLKDAMPNPSGNMTQISAFIAAGDATAPVLALYDITGKELMHYALKEGANKLDVSTSDLPSGIYIYSLLLHGKVKESKRLSVVR